jgi:predicted AlkP superfamily phosphohydrolase/phosphomutase
MGTVADEAERQEVLAAAEEALSRLRDPEDGKPVVTGFYRREELFEGPLLETMPDMVINMRDWSYRGISSTAIELAREEIFRPQAEEWKELGHTGTHRRDGILFFDGPDIASKDIGEVQMVDVAPTIMALLELPSHADWDGRVLKEVLGEGIAVPEKSAPGYETRSPDEGDRAYSAEEEEEIRKRLENLGYL